MTISFSGLASGLDTSSWIEALTSIRQLSVTSLQNKKTSITSEQAEMSKIQSLFSNVQTALDRITDSKFGGSNDLFVQKSVDTNGSEAFTATVTTTALPETYNIYVQQLATATVARSTHEVSQYASLDTVLSDLGVKGGSFTIWLNGEANGHTINVDESMSIRQFNQYLKNTAHLDASMSIDSEGRINFMADGNGSIRMSSVVDESNLFTKLGFTEVRDLANNRTYFRTQNSYYAMGLDSRLVHEASDNVYTNDSYVRTGHVKINYLDFEITSTTTLGDLVNAINRNQDESLATAVWDDAEGKLKLTSTTEGYSHITIKDVNNATHFAAAFGLDNAEAQETGQNAIININGSENIYLSGMCTTALSRDVVSTEKPIETAGTVTTATSLDLSELYTGSGSVSSSTTLNQLGIDKDGKFKINGQIVTYSKNDSIDTLVNAIHAAGRLADDDQKYDAKFDTETRKITVVADDEGAVFLDFDSVVGNDTSTLLAKLGFTKQNYVKVSHMIPETIDPDSNGATVTSTARINGSTATYYSKATSNTLSGAVSDNLSAFGNSSNVSLGLSGDYEIKVNGHSINFTASESMGILLSKISEVSGVTATYTDNKLVLTSDIVGSNLRIEDVTGDFANKMGYTNGTPVDISEINPLNYNPYNHSIELEVSNDGIDVHNTLTSTNLQNILGDTVTGATKLWQLGIENSVFSVEGHNINVSKDWSITQLCGNIEQNASEVTAKYDTASKSIVLMSKAVGGSAPIDIAITSGNVSDVLGWTDSYSVVQGNAPGQFQLQNQDFTTVSSNVTVNASNASNFASIVEDNDVIGLTDKQALQALSTYVSAGHNCAGKTFYLTNDISLSGVDWTPIGYTGDDEAVQYSFSGVLNGNGYAIKDMTVSQGKMAGLFAYVTGGTISNLKVTDANVHCDGNHAGLIASMASNAYISNCYTSGSVSAGLDEVGGLVGYMTNSTITDSYSLSSVSGRNSAGGLVGRADSSTIVNSEAYNNVTATGYTSIGGLVGQSNSTSYSNCRFYDSAHNGVGNSGSTVYGVERDIGAAPPTTGASPSLTSSTSLATLGITDGSSLKINGVATATFGSGDTVNTVVQKINNLQSTTHVTADVVNGKIKLTSSEKSQAIVVTDGDGSSAALRLGLNPGYASVSLNSSQNNFGKGTYDEPIWKVNKDSKICGNATDFKADLSTGTFYINDYEFTLTESTTLEELMNKVEVADIGVVMTYDNGKIKFSSTNGVDFKMRAGESDFTEALGFTHTRQETTYSMNTSAFTQSVCFDVNAKMTSAPNLFNSDRMVNEGTFYVNGVEFNIDADTTLAGLIEDINHNNEAFAHAELVYNNAEHTVKLSISSMHPSGGEVSVLGGTSNFTDIVRLTEDQPELREVEVNQVEGTKTVYKEKANLSSKLIDNNQFKSYNGLEFEEGMFTINGVNFTINNSTTLGGIIEDINNSAAGVTAYWNSQQGKLLITSKTEGDTKINFTDGDSNFLTVMRINEDQAQTLGTKGYYSFTGGSTYSSNTNQITSDITGIEGLTINLTGVSQSANNRLIADKLTVGNDTTYLEASVLDFVNLYNELVTELDSATSTTGIFHNDVGLKSLASQLKSSLNSTANTGSTKFSMLAQLGVTTAAPGAALNSNTNLLSIDLNKLHRVVSTDLSEVKKFMLGTNEDSSNGVMTNLSKLVFNTMTSNGFFATRSSLYGSQISRYETLITTAKTRVSNYKASLETKFASMEKLISNLQTAYAKMYGTLGVNTGAVPKF